MFPRASFICQRLFVVASFAFILSGLANGAELTIVRAVLFDQHQPGVVDDPFYEGGGTCTTCLSLESGLDLAASQYQANYSFDPGPPYDLITTYSKFTGVSGGSVSYGVIRGFVSGSLETTEVKQDNYYVDFRGSWKDSVTIDGGPLNGQSGTMTASVLIEYTPSTSVIASPVQTAEDFAATLDWVLYSIGTVQAGFNQYEFDDGGPESFYYDNSTGASTSPAPWSVVVPLTYSFIFGQPFDLGLEMLVTAHGGGPGGTDSPDQEWQVTSGLNFLNTAAWQGISSVTDGYENPVEYTLSSESGTNWAQAAVVPLPAGAWLLGSSLLSLAWRIRRRPAVRG